MLKTIGKIIIAGIIALVLPAMAFAARTDNLWDYPYSGNYYTTNGSASGVDLLIFGSNHYLNFGAVSGTNGYGFRDSSGTMQFKNSGGNWAALGGGGGGGGGAGTFSTSTSQVSNELTNYPNNNSDIVTIGSSATSSAKFYFDPNISLAVLTGRTSLANASSTQLTVTGATWLTGIGSLGGVSIGSNGKLYSSATTTFSSPLLFSAGNVTCQVATGSVPGCLSAADWTTFNGKGSGTVTAVSVASANGLAGSSSGGATPALTLSTSVTGVLKGNGTAISAASNGTDYTLTSAVTCNTGFGLVALTAVGGSTCGNAFSTTSADAYINASSTIAHPAGGATGNVIQWDGAKFVSVATSTLGLGGSGGGSLTTLTAGTNITFSSGSTCTTTCTINVAGSTTPNIQGVGVSADYVDSNSLILGSVATPEWEQVYPADSSPFYGGHAYSHYIYDGTYGWVDGVNLLNDGWYNFREFRFKTPSSVSSLTFSLPVELAPGVGSGSLSISIWDAGGTTVEATQSVTLSSSWQTASVTWNSPSANTEYMAIITVGSAQTLVGRASLTMAGTPFPAEFQSPSAFTRIQVGKGMLWDDLNEKIDSYQTIGSPFSRFVFDTTATTTMIELTSTLYGAYPDLAYLTVKVNGVPYATTSATVSSSIEWKTINLPPGMKRVEIMNSGQINTSVGTWIRALYVPSSDFTQVDPQPQKPHQIVIYGDSIVGGEYASSTGFNAWPVLLRDQYNSGNVSIFGFGSHSLNDDYSSTNGFSDMVAHVKRSHPTDIWLAIGTNDFGLNRWSAADFGAAYGLLLDQLHASIPGARIYAQSPLQRANQAIPNTFSNTMLDYSSQISSQAALRTGYVTFVDGQAILALTDLSPDSLHPSKEGNQKYATFVANLGVGTTTPLALPAYQQNIFTDYPTIGGLKISAVTGQTADALTVVGTTTTNILCIITDCRSAWPSAGGGVYPFQVAGNATSTLTQFNGGLTAFASSTIGNGLGNGGLTVNGTATTSTLCLGTDCRSVWPSGGSGSYPFTLTGNATSTLTQFNGGLTGLASSTIGNGVANGGLTVNGNATTTGAIIQTGSATSTFAGPVTIGASTASTTFMSDYAGHMMTGGNVPTCGANCTSVIGDDNVMRMVTGSSVSSATVNFATTWKNSRGASITPACVAVEESAGTVAVNASSTPSTVVLEFASALTSVRVAVHCIGSDNFLF